MRTRSEPVRRRGLILVAVLIVIAMLTYSAYEFSHWISIETDLTLLAADDVQARYLAESGGALVEVLTVLRATGQEIPEPANNPDLFEAITIPLGPMDTGSTTNEETGRFTVFCQPLETSDDNLRLNDEPTVRLGVESEAGRIHLNHWFAKDPAALESVLLELPNATTELVSAILDWMDADDVARSGGAERDDYEEVDPPIQPRNGPLESIEELLLVRGMTREILFGEDANGNGILDPNENDGTDSLPFDNQDGTLDRGWAPLLTLESVETSVDSAGQPAIDLNDPDLGRLYTLVLQSFGEEWARFIVAARVLGMPTMQAGLDPSLPGSYFFQSPLDLVDGAVSGTWEGKPVAVDSPVTSVMLQDGETLDRLLERFSVHPVGARFVRLDLGWAAPVSLGLLKSLTESERSAILENRPDPSLVVETSLGGATLGQDEEEPNSLSWLVKRNLIPWQRLREIEPDSTNRSPVVRFHCVGFFEDRRSSYHLVMLLDGTTAPPRVLSRRRSDRWESGNSLERWGQGSDDRELPTIGESASLGLR